MNELNWRGSVQTFREKGEGFNCLSGNGMNGAVSRNVRVNIWKNTFMPHSDPFSKVLFKCRER